MNLFFILKKFFIVLIITIIFFIGCKLTVFYIPFVIGYLISLLVDPIIKYLTKKTNISRKFSSIIVLALIFVSLSGILIYGGTKLISEATNLLGGLNEYLDNEPFKKTGVQSYSVIEFTPHYINEKSKSYF